MRTSGIIGVASLIVAGSIVYTIVSHPESVKVVKAFMDGFTGAIKASQGR